MPDIDLRGRSEPISPRAEPPVEDIAASVAESLVPELGTDSVQSVPFENCIQMLESNANAFGAPASVEDGGDRRVFRYKFAEGSLTVTCSRSDSTLRIEHGR